ncbi:MAG: hypothetical protein AVO38_03610 [delta proteobacterium ML8_D]|nr:MAG: hypothetical protein AVO38_03610 [delta proteobacterium ML8_D]
MTDRYCKRITVRFRSPEVISRIEELPSGFISMVIEASVAAYFDSETGSNLVELLIQRNNNYQKPQPSASISQYPTRFSKKPGKTEAFSMEHLTGDFKI